MEPVKYKEMLAEAANQMQQRVGLLSKRVFLITWPVLVLIGLHYIVFSEYSEQVPMLVRFSFLLGWVAFAVFYGLVMGIIFHIEKTIWIDSYFDGRNLTAQQSWKISRRLFFPIIKLDLILMVRYLLPTIVVICLGFYFAWPVTGYFYTHGSAAQSVGGAIGIGLLFFLPIMYLYIISLKLRFIWFLFLDTYGSNLPWRDFFAELKKLNAVAKRESFTKTVVADFGSWTVKGIAASLILGLQSSITNTSREAQVVGDMVGTYANSVASEMASLGRTAAVYLLYRYAREELYHKPQEVNEALYNLERE